MEIIESATPDLNINCPKCHQKQQLIHKYQSLITLLKKKADRTHSSHLSQSQKLSIGDLTTSHASFNTAAVFNRYILVLALVNLQQKIKYFAFSQIKTQSYTKKCQKCQQFLNKLQKICTIKQKICFNKLKQLPKNQKSQNILCSQSLIDNHHIFQEDMTNVNGTILRQKQKSEKEMNSPLNKKSGLSQLQNSITIDQWNYKSLICLHEDLLTSVNKSVPNSLRQESLPLLLSKKSSSSSQQIKNLYKNLFILQQQNYAYQIKIKNLERHMEEALSRQIKDNRKKTQSLQMVAQQMAQKNELITELQEKITMLEERYECETNGVLEDELTQHRKQVEKLQKVNIKLDNQLRKIRQKLTETESSLHQLQNHNSLNIKLNDQLKENLFELEQKLFIFQSRQINFGASCNKIQKILSKLKLQQKNLKSPNLHSNDPFSSQEKPSLEEFYRLELVFIFIYNIDDETYNFNEHHHLFDEEQLQVLNQLKSKFSDIQKKLERKVDLMQTIHCPSYGLKQTNFNAFQKNLKGQNMHSNNEDIYCHQNMVDGSIFDVLDGHPQNVSRTQSVPKHSQRIEPEKNFTMKLLQMELQKNKQIQKISELKQKNMYIRNIILNLMKSLQLKQPSLKTQTSGILDLIFDVFQYSEEQKQIMFSQAQQAKQKRFFGFI